MNYKATLAILLFGFIACQPATDKTALELLKEDLATKKTELSALKKEVAGLEGEILKLDPPKEKPRRLVTTKVVMPQDFERFVEVQGAVESDEVAFASSETGGRLTKVLPEEGQYVSRGELIAAVDLESLDMQKAELQTSLSLAKDLLERQQRLWDQKIGTEVQYLQAKNNVERLEKSLETLDFQLKKSSVFAPISGVVDNVFLKGGELAGPGTPIVQILNISKLKVKADVPERYLKSIRRGQSVKIEFPALETERNAKISRISPTVNPGNRTFQIEMNVRNSNKSLKPNLLASVYFKEFSQKDVFLIPLETVQQEIDGDNYVFVKGVGDKGEYAKKVLIEVGESDKGQIIVNEGLKGGEALIIQGALGLGDNELIKEETAKLQNNG